MIRFACPGCQATYSVPDDKGGKAGRCPKCDAGFVIPGAAEAQPGANLRDDSPAPVLDAVPVSDAGDEVVEIAPCPGCQARLSVQPADLGASTECPYCQSVFKAVAARPAAAPEPADPFPRRSRRRPSEETEPREDDRPSRRRSRRDDADDDRPSRRRLADEDDEDDDYDYDRPSRRPRRRRRPVESKRVTAGVLAILLGFLGVHKFYLGYTVPGILLIFGNCVGVSGVIALVEGIIYLSKSDDEFVEAYQDGRKEWF